MSSECLGKSSWPELVGVSGSTAAETVERENPYVDAVIVPEGTVVTQDFLCSRVRIWINVEGIVVDVPRIG